MTDSTIAAPIRAADRDAGCVPVQPKVNTALSLARVPIGFDRIALRH
jgi:hypothetical protein